MRGAVLVARVGTRYRKAGRYTVRLRALPSAALALGAGTCQFTRRNMADMSNASLSPSYVRLPGRAVLAVTGEDARGYLQGLVSNDIDKVTAKTAIYAALLTPQGKYLHDFFIAEHDGALLLDCEAARLDDLVKRLTMYKLRARVSLDKRDDLAVFALIGDGAIEAAGLAPDPGACSPFAGGLAFADPRLAAIGARALLPADANDVLRSSGYGEADEGVYDARRIVLGLPDSGRDLLPDKSLLLETGFDELRGVDFEKGCYVGQEVTARMKHRNLVRKRILPVDIDGPAPPPGAAVLRGEVTAGEVLSTADGQGLAMLRLDQVEGGGELKAGDATLTPRKPDWVQY